MQDFFERYASVSLTGSPEELAGFYASGFAMAGPRGVYGGLNDERFLGWLGHVQAFNRESGMKSLRPVAVPYEVVVGPDHRLVTVRWGACFDATGDREIEFEVSYLLQMDGPRIVASVSHEDQEERMRAEGLLAGPQEGGR